MPVRNRPMYDEYGVRDYCSFPPAHDEVRRDIEARKWMASQASWSA
jgi:hypothetical protein